MTIRINGADVAIPDDARVTLLDLLREKLHLTGTKVGCKQGACGACTVIVDDVRVLSCLTLAAQMDGRAVTTIEGLAEAELRHPLQDAFIESDGFQCGYCTPGQICSAVAMLREAKSGMPSLVTSNLTAGGGVKLTREEVRERMSGNLCRCGAHNGIVDAIMQVAEEDVA
jgi:xanthine dehydrogenase YagT iron-sulfur-binding subunit